MDLTYTEAEMQGGRSAFSIQAKLLAEELRRMNNPRVNFSTILHHDALWEKYSRKRVEAKRMRHQVRFALNLLTKGSPEAHYLHLEQIRGIFRKVIESLEAEPSLVAWAKQVEVVFSDYENYAAELDALLKDLGRWGTYRLTNRIGFFVSRVQMYLKGGVLQAPAIGQEKERQVRGLGSYRFGVSLAEQVQQDAAVKKLLMYPSLLAWVKRMDDTIKYALNDKDKEWKGFNEFYDNLHKGKNYIKMMREIFENEEVASFLEKLELDIHQNPGRWVGELDKLQFLLKNDASYQNKSFLYPAMRRLSLLLHTAEGGSATNGGLKSGLSGTLRQIEGQIEFIERSAEEDRRRMREIFLTLDTHEKVDVIDHAQMALEDLIVGRGESIVRKHSDARRLVERRDGALSALKASVRNAFAGRSGSGVALFMGAEVDRSIIALVGANDNEDFYLQELRRLEGIMERTIFPHLEKVRKLSQTLGKAFVVPLSTQTELLEDVEPIVGAVSDGSMKKRRVMGESNG